MKILEPKIFGAGIVDPNPRWCMPPHFHGFHEIIVITSGRLLLKTKGSEFIAKSGDILFYRSGLVHEEISDPRAPVRICFVDFDTGDLLPWLPLRTNDNQGRVRQLVSWIIEDEYTRQPQERRRPLLESLLGEMRRLSEVPSSPWLEGIRTFARENMAKAITLDDLAIRGKMSRFAFVRKFKRLSGRTPMEELRHIRLMQARTLLLTTSLPVKAIAPAVGIGDEYQLSKLFRKHFKLSPRDLRVLS